MAISKIISLGAQVAAKGAKNLGKNSSAYKTALGKIANVIPEMKPTVFSFSEVAGLAKFKGVYNQKAFGIAEALLGDGATLTLAKKSSKLTPGASIMGAVEKDADGKTVLKEAALVDDAKGTINTKLRSSYLDLNKRFAPDELTPEALFGSQLKITGKTGSAETGDLTLKLGEIFKTECQTAGELLGVPSAQIAKDSVKNAKKFFLKGVFPDFGKMIEAYQKKSKPTAEKSRLTKFLEGISAKRKQLVKDMNNAATTKKVINKTLYKNTTSLKDEIKPMSKDICENIDLNKIKHALKHSENPEKLAKILENAPKKNKIGFN